MTLQTDLEAIIQSLRDAVSRQHHKRVPSHDDFSTWGWALSRLTNHVDDLGQLLREQVVEYGNQRILRDDENRNPDARLVEAAELLKKMTKSLSDANEAARQFHSAISHVDIATGPNVKD